MSTRAPRIVPPPRRASPSQGRQESSTPTRGDAPRGPPLRTPPRRAPSRSIDRSSQDSGSFRDANNAGVPVSRPAELPQQVGPRDDPPPVRRSNTPVSSARPIAPPVRSHPPPSTIVSSFTAPLASSINQIPVRNEPQLFSSRDGEQQVPAGAPTGAPQLAQSQRRSTATPPTLAERQAVLHAVHSTTSVPPSSSSTPPNDPPFGPSRPISLVQQSLQSQNPQPHSSTPTPLRGGGISLVDVSTFSPGGGSPLIVDLRHSQQHQPATSHMLHYSSSANASTADEQQQLQYRRPTSLGDSPSSPPTGRRSVLAPVKTLVSTRTIADSDRSVVSSLSRTSHLPEEHQLMNHSANSFCFVQSSAASRYQPVRTPATSVEAEKPAPPPFIQQSISRPADASATYAPRAARWDYLEQAPQAEPRRSGGGGGLAQSESAYVLCIVQVVASEAHFTSDESFDPVPEIRLRLRDLGSVTVKRLTDLIHVSINYPPRHRGVVRCYAAENRPWVIKIPGPKGGAAKCVSMAPFDAPLSEFVNVEELMLPYESSNSEAVLHLRWVEDAQVMAPASADASAGTSAVPHEERRNEVPQPLLLSVRGPSVSSTSTTVSLGGYRVERDHTPITFVPDARSTPSHLLQQQWHNHVPFTLAAPSSATHSQFHSRTPSETIPVLRVPSRSASATSTPNMSPVRRTPGATTPAAAERQGPVVPTSRTAADTRSDVADSYHIQPERLLTASEGVLRFGQHPLVAPAPSSSRGPSPQRSVEHLGQDAYTAPTTPINSVRPISQHHLARSASGIDDDAVFGADSAVAPSSRASSTIVIDGVSYTPTSSRTQQLADEIAALRSAIFSEDRQLTQAKGLLQQEFPKADARFCHVSSA
jgi:hypothetical protein